VTVTEVFAAGFDTAALEAAFDAIVKTTIGELTPGTVDTPRRAAHAWQELTSGYAVDVPGLFTVFDAEGYDEQIAVKAIPFDSLCEHHLLGFTGTADIVYLPGETILGLSKEARIVQAYARRLQNQERLTANIADALTENLKPRGVLVVCEAEHSCMRCRGVRSRGTMVTSITRGAHRDNPATRAEAFALIGR
jgi:GTP cyclohydrolase IA